MKTEKSYRTSLVQLGKIIYLRRVNKYLTTKQIAAELNIAPTAYRNIENGKSDPGFAKLLHIAEILEMDAKEFMNGEK